MTTALHPFQRVKLKTASGGSYQKPLKSFGDLTFKTQYCTGFAINLSANSPSVSCSTSEDPVGIDGGLNMFNFVGSNPVKFTDKFGLERDWSSEMPNGGSWSHMKGGEFTALFGASPAELLGWTIEGTLKDIKEFDWCCFTGCMLKKNAPTFSRKIGTSFMTWMVLANPDILPIIKSQFVWIVKKFGILFYGTIVKSIWDCYVECRE